jgi:hypothetical protein
MSGSGQTAKWPAVCGKSAYPSISDITHGSRLGSDVALADSRSSRAALICRFGTEYVIRRQRAPNTLEHKLADRLDRDCA